MATESDKPNVPSTPESTPPPRDPGAAPVGKSDKPPEKRRFEPSGRAHKRVREAVPSLEADLQYHQKNAPNVRDLDAEIADELDAALKGMDDKELYGADDSKRARDVAAAQADRGRKKGTVISVRPPDIFVEIPGGRGQGVLTMEQFPDGPPKVGTEVEISIEGYDPENGLLLLSRHGSAVHADWSSVAEV